MLTRVSRRTSSGDASGRAGSGGVERVDVTAAVPR
jgi:hypothetical protein